MGFEDYYEDDNEPWFCPHCGYHNETDSDYCMNCDKHYNANVQIWEEEHGYSGG